MPHDKNKRPLKAGDLINIPAIILVVREGEFCTMDVETLYVMPGNNMKNTIYALNAAQAELRKPAELLAPCPPATSTPKACKGSWTARSSRTRTSAPRSTRSSKT